MSDTGKRKGGVFQRLGNWFGGTPPPPSNQQGMSATGGNEYSQWSSGYDDTLTSGDVYVGGIRCNTVGQVKAETARFYGLDIE